jgi:hypothetical protein
MVTQVFDQDYVNLIVEQTSNIEAWEPTLSKLSQEDCGTDVYAPIRFNEDYTKLLLGEYDTSTYSINILLTYGKFQEYFSFFVERVKDGDIISAWESLYELNYELDEEAGIN